MNYYENATEYAALGIESDLASCLEYNPQGFSLEDIARVLAVVESENDGPDWHWILSMKDGRFIYLSGGCDYTGWDCQSGASHKVATSAEEAIAAAEGGYSGPSTDGLRSELTRQLAEGKHETWHEKKDREFGIVHP